MFTEQEVEDVYRFFPFFTLTFPSLAFFLPFPIKSKLNEWI